jgi:hypothetical protein
MAYSYSRDYNIYYVGSKCHAVWIPKRPWNAGVLQAMVLDDAFGIERSNI